MRKAKIYRTRAGACRTLARNAETVADRSQLLAMAKAWILLALKEEEVEKDPQSIGRHLVMQRVDQQQVDRDDAGPACPTRESLASAASCSQGQH
jgi:hypothetical protein